MLAYKAKKRKGKDSLSKSRDGKGKGARRKPVLDDFVGDRDFEGALALLEFNLKSGEQTVLTNWWIGYCAFHLGRYQRAIEAYEDQLRELDRPSAGARSEGKRSDAEEKSERSESSDGKKITVAEWPRNEQESMLKLHLACCRFYLGDYQEALDLTKAATDGPLKNRLLFHLSYRMNDDKKLVQYHQKLSDTKEDELSLAAIHFLRGHYQEATDIYKRLLIEDKSGLALNVYVAMCYYKLDYYDVSLEILQVYLATYPASIVAINLKACNHFRLYNGKAAEAEVKVLSDHNVAYESQDLIKHNLVVFRDGENALQVLPPLVDVVPEARLNLVIYYLKNDDVAEAYELIRDLNPGSPQEYILKAVVNAALGQQMDPPSQEHLKMARSFFQLVGASASECDTIPGRQCMASCFFLLKQFEDVNIYLNSIKAYLYSDDDFNWNYGISLASTGQYKDAEETLLLVQSDRYRNDTIYLLWLARCYIFNGKAQQAWELYLKMDTSNESFNMLQLIANECYRTGAFYYSAKAFDVLERLDGDPEHWEGKRGACVGVFQMVIAGKESKENLADVLGFLRNTSNPQVEYIIRTIKRWCQDKGIRLPTTMAGQL